MTEHKVEWEKWETLEVPTTVEQLHEELENHMAALSLEGDKVTRHLKYVHLLVLDKDKKKVLVHASTEAVGENTAIDYALITQVNFKDSLENQAYACLSDYLGEHISPGDEPNLQICD